ncbi:MAG: ThiF family adenylyltransferase [Deltaproteobacteria bacterium]|nr:ThiF family adenylyltransferase [Deltaproteobacteria bacterium]
MSRKLLSHSPDLKRLCDDGYVVDIIGGLLLVRDIPYVGKDREVRRGTLVSTLALAGDVTKAPDTHVVHFAGEYPCHADGRPIEALRNASGNFDLGQGVRCQHRFSSKPPSGRYVDYHEKMTTYANIISGHSHAIKSDASPRTYRGEAREEDSVFEYVETASGRAGIGALTDRLVNERIAIIGLGGTGSYILDLVAKTPVREIHLFDGDLFLQHNAFRSPGAATIGDLKNGLTKVEYFSQRYGAMHRGIQAHAVKIRGANLGLLDGTTFAFLCMDGGPEKRQIMEKLTAKGASFIDVGMGLELVDGTLGGILRVTASTPARNDHLHRRIPTAGDAEEDVYASNIQVADLNALNAVLATIKWKKIRGFYRDLEGEYHCTYTTDGNQLVNSETGREEQH